MHQPKRVCTRTLTRWMPPTGDPPKWFTGARHAAGTRRHLPWGSDPFGVFAWAIVAPVYLTGTIRSQGFSPSQRFEPARAPWLCFTPHPPLGFRSSELFPRGQPQHLSVLVTLVPLQLAPVSLGRTRAPPSPPTSATSRGLPLPPAHPKWCSRLPVDGIQHQPGTRTTEVIQEPNERSKPAGGG